jgi:ribonucleotide reductase beta subunit family protein with ferritin-like domain
MSFQPISLIELDNTVKDFTKKQLSIFWLPDEPKVEKDIQDIMVNLTENEKHGVLTVLKLFSLYELQAGEEYWGNRFKHMFPDRIEYVKMANAFSFFETNIHLPFYNRINELLHINTDEYYNSYVKDPTLKARMEFIGSIIDSKDDLYSIACFSMVEGVILYSSFAFLKHFQSKGKNKLLNVVRGINFSVRDENLHSIGGAYAFKDKLSTSKLSDSEKEKLFDTIRQAAEAIKEHEFRIIDMIFEKGNIDGITGTQLKHFVESRVNLVLQQLGLEKLYEVTYNPLADWFYSGINGFQYNDFFSGIGASYSREWSESEFVWGQK